jgi:hypothetical protein
MEIILHPIKVLRKGNGFSREMEIKLSVRMGFALVREVIAELRENLQQLPKWNQTDVRRFRNRIMAMKPSEEVQVETVSSDPPK